MPNEKHEEDDPDDVGDEDNHDDDVELTALESDLLQLSEDNSWDDIVFTAAEVATLASEDVVFGAAVVTSSFADQLTTRLKHAAAFAAISTEQRWALITRAFDLALEPDSLVPAMVGLIDAMLEGSDPDAAPHSRH